MIEAFALIFSLLSMGAMIYGVGLLFNRGRRKNGLIIIPIAFVVWSVGMGTTGNILENREALNAGFQSAQDMKAAEEIAQEEAIRLKAKKLEEEAAKAEAERLEKKRIAKAEAAEEKRKGFHCLSPWDGSHRDFKQTVKDSMREPDSFEHIETRITPVNAEGYHRVLMKYRARNGFGGINVGEALGLVLGSNCAVTLLYLE